MASQSSLEKGHAWRHQSFHFKLCYQDTVTKTVQHENRQIDNGTKKEFRTKLCIQS